MGTFIDLTGQKFYRLTVIERAPNRGKQTVWRCRCDCGNETQTRAALLTRGHSKSCGCFNIERTTQMGKANKDVARKHGHARDGNNSRTYQAWVQAKSRCHNPNDTGYYLYGARGIIVEEPWFSSFPKFLEDMGECPPGMTLDRFPDRTGNYKPGNCRWATRKEQSRNTSRNILLTINNETLCIAEWAERVGVEPHLIYHRIKKGFSPEWAVFKPVNHTDSYRLKKSS